MSSILLNASGYVRLAAEIAYRAEDSNHNLQYACREFIGVTDYETDDCHPAASLVCQELFDMNAAAVNHRYDASETSIKLSFVQLFPEWSDIQFLKYVICVRYQCAEGDEIVNSSLYKRLEAFIGRAAEGVVRALPEYDDLRWTWPDEPIEPEPPVIQKKGKPFSLGQVFITPGARDAIVGADQRIETFLRKHLALEQGELGEADHSLNLAAAESGDDRILTKYRTRKGEFLYIITEHTQEATTVLLPSEY